jgi:hypothetical protein
MTAAAGDPRALSGSVSVDGSNMAAAAGPLPLAGCAAVVQPTNKKLACLILCAGGGVEDGARAVWPLDLLCKDGERIRHGAIAILLLRVKGVKGSSLDPSTKLWYDD